MLHQIKLTPAWTNQDEEAHNEFAYKNGDNYQSFLMAHVQYPTVYTRYKASSSLKNINPSYIIVRINGEYLEAPAVSTDGEYVYLSALKTRWGAFENHTFTVDFNDRSIVKANKIELLVGVK